MLSLSANLGFLWPELPLPRRIAAAAKAGFAAVEFHWPYNTDARQLRALCDQLGLSVVCINSNRGDVAAGEFGMAALPGNEGRFRRDVDSVLGYAETIGARHVHVLAGLVDEDAGEAAEATLLDNLRHAADAASSRGIGILIEPMNPVSRPGYLLNSADQAIRLLDTLGHPNVSMLFDVFHVAQADGDALRRLRHCLPQVGHCQIASVPDRHEPDHGDLDYRAVFQILSDHNYAGFVGCEYNPIAGTEKGLAWRSSLVLGSFAGGGEILR